MATDKPEDPKADAVAEAAAAKAAAERAKQCKEAYRLALEAANAAAKALKIDPPGDSPLVKELTERGGTIPDGTDAGIVADFIEQMKQIEEAAKALEAAAS